jgi:tripartite-type tricarboxylate transporter receptor subunit TctC
MYSLIVTILPWFALIVASSPWAQPFPNRPIRLIVPTAASGTQDTNARAVAKQVASQIGQQIVIDNRGGANGIIGAQIVANAAPDGYTLLYTGNAFIINQNVVKNLPYSLSKDFVPITSVAESKGALLLVHPSLSTRCFTSSLIAIGRPHSRLVSPGHFFVASTQSSQ